MTGTHHPHNPHHTVHHRKKHYRKNLYLVVALIVPIVAAIFLYNHIDSNIYRKVPGVNGEVFRVSSGDNSGPRITDGFIDPYYSTVNQKQIFSVHVTDVVPVQSVSVEVKTDNKTSIHELKLLNGSNLDGYWQGRWRISDTNEENYRMVISAKSSSGTSTVEITLR